MRHNQSETRSRQQQERRQQERRNAEQPPGELEITLRDLPWITAFARECESSGGQLWIHGGALRGSVKPNDLDLMVPGLDEAAILRALRRAGLTGRKATNHPVVRVFRGPIPVEISAEPGLTSIVDVRADIHSRDFTVNAAAQRCRGQYQLQAAIRSEDRITHPRRDQDLKLSILRPCLNGEEAVKRHPLLLARAVRLCGQLGFSPSAGLISTAHIYAGSVAATPMRRRAEELMRGLESSHWECALPLLGPELMTELVRIPDFTFNSPLRDFRAENGLASLAAWMRSQGVSAAQASAWSSRGAWHKHAQDTLLGHMNPSRQELDGWMDATEAYVDSSDHPTWRAQHASAGLRIAAIRSEKLRRDDLDAIKAACDEAQEQYPEARTLPQVKS